MNQMVVERNLDFRSLLVDLQREAVLSQDAVDEILSKPRSMEDGVKHPVNYIGEQQAINQKTGKPLDVEALTAWVAEQAGQEYFNLDPLKVRATEVTQVMSFAFAQKHKILAVEVLPNEIKVASCQPFLSAWVENLEHVTNKVIRRVFANPADIERYTTEFYTLAKSITDASADDVTNHSNLEAFLELGELKNPEANGLKIHRVD